MIRPVHVKQDREDRVQDTEIYCSSVWVVFLGIFKRGLDKFRVPCYSQNVDREVPRDVSKMKQQVQHGATPKGARHFEPATNRPGP